MGTITVKVSDLTGEQIPEEGQAARLIVEHPDFADSITLEVLPEEIEEKLPDEDERFVALSYFAPGESSARRFLLPIEEFDDLFQEPESEGILEKLRRVLFATQEEEQEQERGRGRQRRGRRQAGRARQRIDYTSPEHAGEPHRGTISEAERAYVRDNLPEVNERLRGQGIREIDAGDPEMAERYGLTQQPIADSEAGGEAATRV